MRKFNNPNDEILLKSKSDSNILFQQRQLHYNLDITNLNTITIGRNYNYLNENIIRISINSVMYTLESDVLLDLDVTGINGIIDELALETSNRIYLIYAIANEANTQILGFGAARKPLQSVLSASGSALKGDLVTFTIDANAFTFSIGAVVLIRNTVGMAPVYQYNYGVITNITDDVSVQVQLDDNVYGTGITSYAGAEILQWNNFKPYIAGEPEQILYTDNYILIGEICVTATGISKAYKVDNPFRDVDGTVYNDEDAEVDLDIYSSNRYVPYWCNMTNYLVSIDDPLLGATDFLSISTHYVQFEIHAQTNNSDIFGNTGYLNLNNYNHFILNKSQVTNQIHIIGYYVQGGMRI